VRRVLAFAAASVAVLAMSAGTAGATDECEGLDVCISVGGPWVVLPAPAGGERLRRVEFQLACPRGAIVAGLDAVLGDPRIDVTFLGTLGSPVTPGITTGRSVVFVAAWAGDAPTFFRPLIGCLPTSGGGRGTTAVVPRPPDRLVRALRVRPGPARTLVVRCGAARRLVGSSHAVGIRRRAAPTAQMLTAVSVARRDAADRVSVRARRSSGVAAGVRIDVQVHALCRRES
jgi:hypothetical protein